MSLIWKILTHLALSLTASALTLDELAGNWTGTVSSETNPNWNYPLTLNIEADGNYNDSSGNMMPGLYPDTQWVEVEAASNRLIFRYLSTVYAGQYFYTGFYYYIASYTGDSLELHYQVYTDQAPLPHVRTMSLSRPWSPELEAPELSLLGDPDTGYSLGWNEVPGAGQYRVEHSDGMNEEWSTLALTTETSLPIQHDAGSRKLFRVKALAE